LVPSSEKSAVFEEIERSCPRAGVPKAKLAAVSLISPSMQPGTVPFALLPGARS